MPTIVEEDESPFTIYEEYSRIWCGCCSLERVPTTQSRLACTSHHPHPHHAADESIHRNHGEVLCVRRCRLSLCLFPSRCSFSPPRCRRRRRSVSVPGPTTLLEIVRVDNVENLDEYRCTWSSTFHPNAGSFAVAYCPSSLLLYSFVRVSTSNRWFICIQKSATNVIIFIKTK